MPAASRRSTVAEVTLARRAAHMREPMVPMRPSMSHRSLMQIGSPCKGPSGRPAARARSAPSASWRASSAYTAT